MIDFKDLLASLDSDGATGLDLSPGDPTAKEAAKVIRELQAENEGLRESVQAAIDTAGVYDSLRPPREWLQILRVALIPKPPNKLGVDKPN